MRWHCLLLALLTFACGGAQSKSATPDDNGSGLETAETRCLAKAEAPRERKKSEPEKIVVKHILVKFAGAKNAGSDITRTRGAACMRALEAITLLKNGETWASVVASYSDEPGAATREGSIGAVKRSDVVPAFADAAFELEPTDVSYVVATDFGFHVIMRTE